jgi:hypothetical protein
MSVVQTSVLWGRVCNFFDNSRVQVSDFFFQKSTTGPGLWKLEISNNRSGFFKCKWATVVRRVGGFNAFEGGYTISGLYQKPGPISSWVLSIILVLWQKHSQSLLIFYPVLRNEIFNFFHFHKTYWHLGFRVHGLWNSNPKFKERILLTKSFEKA